MDNRGGPFFTDGGGGSAPHSCGRWLRRRLGRAAATKEDAFGRRFCALPEDRRSRRAHCTGREGRTPRVPREPVVVSCREPLSGLPAPTGTRERADRSALGLLGQSPGGRRLASDRPINGREGGSRAGAPAAALNVAAGVIPPDHCESAGHAQETTGRDRGRKGYF